VGEFLPHVPRWLVVAVAVSVALLANLSIAVGTATGQKAALLVEAVAIAPALLIVFGSLIESHRALLAWAALAINLTGIPLLSERLPLPGATSIYPTDVLLLLAVGAGLASRLSGIPGAHPVKLSRVFGWPLALLTVTVLYGIFVGHERYGVPIVGEPLRFLLYAGIALALTDVDVSSAWKAITIVFYSGAVAQALWAVYYIATGRSQTRSDLLTTGGVRVLALSVAIYLTGSLVCALLNLELEHRGGRQLLHLSIAGLALFGIVVSFGRTTWAAVVLILPLLLVTRRYMRGALLVLAPLLAPILVVAAILVTTLTPTVVPTIQSRLSGTSTDDGAIVWRERARESVLQGVDKEWLTGVGFGRVTEFEMTGQIITLHGDPHNSFIFLLAGGGVLALGSFLVLCATYVVDAVRRLRRASSEGQVLIAWSLSTWFAFMINALAGPIFTVPEMVMTIWILIALPSVVLLRPSA
jgi:O-antigen ligase